MNSRMLTSSPEKKPKKKLAKTKGTMRVLLRHGDFIFHIYMHDKQIATLKKIARPIILPPNIYLLN